MPDRPQLLEHVLDGERLVLAGRSIVNGEHAADVCAIRPDGSLAWSRRFPSQTPIEVRSLVALGQGASPAVVISGADPFFDLPTAVLVAFANEPVEPENSIVVLDTASGDTFWSDAWSGGQDATSPSALQLNAAALAGDVLLATGSGVDGDGFFLESYRVSYGTPSLTADVGELSLSAGGTQTLALRAGVPAAGLVHLLLGSATGTTGIDLGSGVVLPLTLDAWTLLTLRAPNSGPLINTLGGLDALAAR
ncbi:MAG: hypothetical protein AAFZ65_20710 [Planctomycetota bacterium]